MEIVEEKEPKPADLEAVKPELPSEKTNGDDHKEPTLGELLATINPTYGRFAPRRRRVFRFRLPFTYDYE